MKHFFGTLALGLMTFTLVGTSGCKLSDCGADEQEGSDGACIQGKSLSKFDGTDVSKTVDYQAGGSVTISTVYGNVTIEGGAPAGKVEVIFKPFDFEAYDEKELATRQMNENLNLHIQDGANIDVTAARKGSPSNGLGTSITVKLPPEFDGNLTVMNHGDGPLANDGEFDVEVNAVASAKTVTVTNEASLGDCTVNGGASVVSTGVTCRDDVMVHGVSSVIALCTGPVQFVSAVRARWPRVHRHIGCVYFTSVAVGAASGFYMGLHAFGGSLSRAGFCTLSVLWLITALWALRAIRRRRIQQHRAWMLRNFALTFAAVLIRVYLNALQLAGFSFEAVYPYVSWMAWAPALAVAEIRIASSRQSASPLNVE